MWRRTTQKFCSRVLSPQNEGLQRFYSDGPKVMAIRRETINVWERRAPLNPQQVRKLVKSGVKVIVQPSNRRAYNMQVSSHMAPAFCCLYKVMRFFTDITVLIGFIDLYIDLFIDLLLMVDFGHKY